MATLTSLPYVVREYTPGSNKLIVSFGYYKSFFKIPQNLKKGASILYLRDPYGFLFYRGLDGKSNFESLEGFLQAEIANFNASEIILQFSRDCSPI